MDIQAIMEQINVARRILKDLYIKNIYLKTIPITYPIN